MTLYRSISSLCVFFHVLIDSGTFILLMIISGTSSNHLSTTTEQMLSKTRKWKGWMYGLSRLSSLIYESISEREPYFAKTHLLFQVSEGFNKTCIFNPLLKNLGRVRYPKETYKLILRIKVIWLNSFFASAAWPLFSYLSAFIVMQHPGNAYLCRLRNHQV